MQSASVDLLSNASATGAAVQWPGGKGSFTVAGTFGGATVSIQALLPDGTSWADIVAGVTANGVQTFEFPSGQIRAAVAGGTPSGLYARAARIVY